jgi:hypothetical protein
MYLRLIAGFLIHLPLLVARRIDTFPAQKMIRLAAAISRAAPGIFCTSVPDLMA